MAAAPDHLFNLRNNFYLGAFQAAINNSDVPNLSPDDAVERDSLVYRSYIALGSYQLVVHEIDASAPTPLQAVKLLALYLSSPENKVPPSYLFVANSQISWLRFVNFDISGVDDLEFEGVVGGSGDREQPHSEVDCWDRVYA